MTGPFRKHCRRSAVAALCGAFALALAFGAPAPAWADDSLSIVAGSAPGIFDALELVAQGAGFYRKEHLNITKNYANSPATAAQLVATGKADVGALSLEPIIQGYEKGLRLQVFLSRQKTFSYVLGVLDSSPIKTLADFKGATLGELVIGSSAEPATASMLGGVGLRKSDYSFVPIGTGAQGLEAILGKKVDGAAFPYTALAQYQVVGNVKMRIFRHPILRDVSDVGYVALPATIGAKADVLRRFSRAIAMAALFVRENPEATARLYLQLQVGGSKVTDDAVRNLTHYFVLVESELPAADPSDPRIGYVSPQGLQLISQLLTDYGITTAVVPSSAIVTDQFIPYANAFDRKAVTALAKGWH
jgi:NitT/TauT family transport system substrate-binding protein